MKENIEEDIEKVSDFINAIGEEYEVVREQQSFNRIVSDYKRLQEEFEQVDHECFRLEQKELMLEKEVELAKEALKKQCDIADERNQLLTENQKLQKENEELKDKWDKDTHILQNDLDIANAKKIELQKENEELKEDNKYQWEERCKLTFEFEKCIPKQKIKDIIERIDYDITKTKEIISNNADNMTSNRKNDYQIVRLKAMNTKSLDIKNRLQELLEEKGE